MRRLMIAALTMVPLAAIAHSGRKSAIYKTEMGPLTLIFGTASEALACGLRSPEWTQSIEIGVFRQASTIAGNLWGRSASGKLSPLSAAHVKKADATFLWVGNIEASADASDCGSLQTGGFVPPLDKIAKENGWNGQ